jgi:hypothetical protein
MSEGGKKQDEVQPKVESGRCRFANLYSTYGSEPELEHRGVVIDYELDNKETFSIKIKRAGARNQEWKVSYNAIMKPHAQDIEDGKLSEGENKELLAEIWSKTVVLGWSNLRDNDGNEVQFSKETCYALFCAFPDLLNAVIADSHARSNFQFEEMEATAKN